MLCRCPGSHWHVLIWFEIQAGSDFFYKKTVCIPEYKPEASAEYKRLGLRTSLPQPVSEPNYWRHTRQAARELLHLIL